MKDIHSARSAGRLSLSLTRSPTDDVTLNAIQALRFLAALLVVVYHANIFADHNYTPRAAESLSMVLAGIGRSGVHIFFVISGFIMMFAHHQAFNQPGAPLRFFRFRLFRIYPTY